MVLLMCMNTPVYEKTTKQVIREDLMPCQVENVTRWERSRMFLRGTNRLPEEDEHILGKDSFTVKRRLSLSDSYWYKYDKDRVESFESISPYFNEFTELDVCVSNKSAPSVTLGGSINKIWRKINNRIGIYKVMIPGQVEAEIVAIALAKRLGLPVNEAIKLSNTELFIINMTEPGRMLMRIQPWDLRVKEQHEVSATFGYDLKHIDRVYKRIGVRSETYIMQALFDAVVSNYDRLSNLSNWGYFKSGFDGSNWESPMYDFNLAHTVMANPYLHIIKHMLNIEHINILKQWRPAVENFGCDVWTKNLDYLIK